MAKLKALPDLEIIRGFKGVIDFYMCRGIPCARAWPRFRPSLRTPASIASARLFGQIVMAYALLAAVAQAFFAEDAADQPRTARDIMVSAVFGKLHEASMSDFLELLQQCLAELQDIPKHANLRIEPGTKELHVMGMDQLFTFLDKYNEIKVDLNATAVEDSLATSPVGAGEIWIITNITAWDGNNVLTRIDINLFDTVDRFLLDRIMAPVANRPSVWRGHAFLTEGDVIEATYVGTILNDDIYLAVAGYKMTLQD